MVALTFNFLFTGCGTHVYIPGNKFMSPEASGHFLGGEFKAGLGGVTDARLTSDMTAVAPDTTPELNKNSTLLVGGQLGLLPALDVYFSAGRGTSDVIGGKLQLIGASAQEAKAENFSVAIAGGFVFGDVPQSSGTDQISGKATVNFSGWEALANIGYRPFDSLLIYAGPFASRTETKAVVERTELGVTTVTARPEGCGEMRGVSLGFRAGTNFFITAEGSLTETVWTRTSPSDFKTDKFTDQAVGVAVGGSW